MKTIFKISAAIVASTLTMAACAPVTLLNTITPSGSFAKAKDVSYGPLARQSLDIYRTDKPRSMTHRG